MELIRLANNAAGMTSSAVGLTDTQIHLVQGHGNRFPAIGPDQWFPVTLVADDGQPEVVRVTSRVDDTLYVQRAQEGTQVKEFPAGTIVELRLTAGIVHNLVGAVSLAMVRANEAKLNAATAQQAASQAHQRIDNAEATLVSLQDQVNQVANVSAPTGLGPLPWSLPSPPDGWIFADGRVLASNTPYKALRNLYINANFPFGKDSNNNPRIPDCRGRVAAGVDGGAGVLSGATLGDQRGSETHTLTVNEMPAHNHPASSGSAGSHSHDASTNSTGSHSHSGSAGSAGAHRHTYNSSVMSTSGSGDRTAATTAGNPLINSSSSGAHTHSVTINSAGSHSHTVSVDSGGAHSHSVTVSNRGGGQAHNNVQPTLVTNMIIKT